MNQVALEQAPEELQQLAVPLFPILQRSINGNPLIYLDSAATSLRPAAVVAAEVDFYHRHNSNVHRGVHSLAAEATQRFEQSRTCLTQLVHAPASQGVIFTRGATTALNMAAQGLEHLLAPGDRIVLTEMEHHANLVPWTMLAKRRGLELRYISIDSNGELDLSDLNGLLTKRTKVVSLTHISNVLGTINPVAKIARQAKEVGAVVVLDAAQSFGHLPLDFEQLGVDLMAFSAHKAYGPMGVGALVGTTQILEQMEPMEGGGEMILEVTYSGATYNELPYKFEAGTPNVAGVVAWSTAMETLQQLDQAAIRRHEVDLTEYALDRLGALDGLTVLGPTEAKKRGGLVSFVDDKIHPHDLATVLDQLGIEIRAGHHCAQPLHRKLGHIASSRASFGLYSRREHVDALVDAIGHARRLLT